MKFEKIVQLKSVTDPISQGGYWVWNADINGKYLLIRLYLNDDEIKQVEAFDEKPISITVEEYLTPFAQVEKKLLENGFNEGQLESIFTVLYDVFPNSVVTQDFKPVTEKDSKQELTDKEIREWYNNLNR